MTNAQINDQLSGQFATLGLSSLPMEIFDRDGRRMDVSGNVWMFNTCSALSYHDWASMRLTHPVLGYALKRYVIRVVELNSSVEALNTAGAFRQLLTGNSFEPTDGINVMGTGNLVRKQWDEIQHTETLGELNDGLFMLMGRVVEALRHKNALYRFHRIRAWFDWAADMFPEFGFSEELALELNQIYVPGNVKGRAVETEETEGGPLWDTEVRALRVALDRDDSTERQHVKQRAAVALGLAYGRNNTNYVLLREEDLSDALEGQPEIVEGVVVEPEWRLNIPRIKKRGVPARGQMRTEYVDKRLAGRILELIEANKEIDTGKLPRPIFMREVASERRIGTGVEEYAFHLTKDDFYNLVRGFAKRMQIISPRTGKVLHLTPRRLRYTFATTMVEQGVSPNALAVMLDHTDVQHVQVYFSLKGKRLTKHLDKAATYKLAGFFRLFTGRVIDSDAEAINGYNPHKKMYFATGEVPSSATEIGICGQEPLCHLDPPFSCYLCALFQPYREADHEGVLDVLLADRISRMEKYGDRLGIQLDDVLIAIANVIEKIRMGERTVTNG